MHGLNSHPDKMEDLAHYFNQLGYDVLNVALYGHRGSLQEMKSASYSAFYEHAKLHMCELLRRAGNDPIIFLGHSTGAVLQGNLLYELSGLAQRKLRVIWLAPAFELRWYTRFIGLVSGPFILPSLSPRAYLANYGTSFNAYSALDEGMQKFKQYFSDNPHVLPPTLIIMDPQDELVDWQANREFFAQTLQVQFTEVRNHSSHLPKKFHHLIIDRESLGDSGWNNLIHTIKNFLQVGE